MSKITVQRGTVLSKDPWNIENLEDVEDGKSGSDKGIALAIVLVLLSFGGDVLADVVSDMIKPLFADSVESQEPDYTRGNGRTPCAGTGAVSSTAGTAHRGAYRDDEVCAPSSFCNLQIGAIEIGTEDVQ